MEIRARERRREYGLSEAEEEADLLRRQHFNRVTLPELDAQLRIVCQSYEVNICAMTRTIIRRAIKLFKIFYYIILLEERLLVESW
jgi:hypothetical protein